VGEALMARDLMLSTAESCTGGWVAQAITDVAGSSQWFERGFVSYSNLAKQEMLGVQSETLEKVGAVSELCVREMVLGALNHSQAQVALAISGIAGPGGGSAQKPVGLVWFAWALKGQEVNTEQAQFSGERQQIREQSVIKALQGVLQLLGKIDG
jgi:nicotinamide-nucleotide amidase